MKAFRCTGGGAARQNEVGRQWASGGNCSGRGHWRHSDASEAFDAISSHTTPIEMVVQPFVPLCLSAYAGQIVQLKETDTGEKLSSTLERQTICVETMYFPPIVQADGMKLSISAIYSSLHKTESAVSIRVSSFPYGDWIFKVSADIHQNLDILV